MNKTSNSVVKHVLALASAAVVSGAMAAYTDGLVQYWDFSQGAADTAAAKADIRDAMTASAATKVIATRIDGDSVSDAALALCDPQRVGFKEMEVTLPFYGNLTRTRTCLYIPQESFMDNTTQMFFSRQVRVPAPMTREEFGPMTVFLRFRLETQNSTAKQLRSLYSYGTTRSATSGGWGLTLYGEANGWALSVSSGSCWTRFNVTDVTGKKEQGQGTTTPYLYSGRWYDLVATVDPTTEEDNVNIYLCEAGKFFRDPDHSYASDKQPCVYHYRGSRALAAPASNAANVQIIGGDEEINGWGPQPTSWNKNDYFNHGVWGAFERVMVWKRILSEDEAYDAMADVTGLNVVVGAANGSADEFGAEGSDELMDPYDVSNPWPWMRKELTAAHPSLTFTFDLPAREVGLARALTVTPILTDVGASAPLLVEVNGAAVGTMDLVQPSSRTFLIPKSAVAPGADGTKMAITLTRTGTVTGTVGIDRLAVSGSWQVGAFDNSEPFMDPLFLPNDYAKSRVIDDRYSTFFASTLCGTNSAGRSYDRCAYRLRFELPEKIANENRARFSFATVASTDRTYAYEREEVTVYVNDEPVAAVTGLKPGSAVNTIDLPAGLFRGGMNEIRLANTTDVAKDAAYWGTSAPWIKFAAHRLEFLANKPMTLIVR